MQMLDVTAKIVVGQLLRWDALRFTRHAPGLSGGAGTRMLLGKVATGVGR
jgi:hypothetical protein